MNIELVRAELARRAAKSRLIGSVINKHFAIQEGAQTKRGVVQALVANQIGVAQNNRLANDVIEWLQANGVRLIFVHGRRKFRNLVSREFLLKPGEFLDERL